MIEVQEKNGAYAARASWGMSAWYRDPLTAVKELFGLAILKANRNLDDDKEPEETPETAS